MVQVFLHYKVKKITFIFFQIIIDHNTAKMDKKS